MKKKRYENVEFAVYYNLSQPHVTVHKIGYCSLDKHGGNHKNNNGGWAYFVKEYEARLFAEAMSALKNLEPSDDIVCFKKWNSANSK